MRSTRGRLLLAGPSLRDPNFYRTVVLMLDHDEDGALGVVLNRPTDHGIAHALPQWAGQVTEPEVVFIGGPVAPETALAVGHLRDPAMPPPGWTAVTASFGIVDLRGPADSLVQEMRIFAGYSGWAPGQLEGELASDAWIVLDRVKSDTITSAPTLLWETVLRRQPGGLALLATYPDEPAWN